MVRAYPSIADFQKYDKNPILLPGSNDWQKGRVYNPTAIVVGDKVALLYRCQGTERKDIGGENVWMSTIGTAWSSDGTSFTAEDRPSLEPTDDMDAAGVEDPRVVHIDGEFVLTYTAYDGKKARLAVAFSKDPSLTSWKERKIVFPEEEKWTKSGAIVPIRISGMYYMYFQAHEYYPPIGESHIWLASSRDLRSWKIFSEPVLKTVRGSFDESEVEPGPTPIITPHGIAVIYNATREAKNFNRREFGIGWALFDKNDPSRLLYRSKNSFYTDESAISKKGVIPQVPFYKELPNQGRITGTIFANGLVKFHNRWFLYYGVGDSVISVASADAPELFSLLSS